MKRLRNLKMTILLMAITGIFGFANVSAVEKYPNKINTEQDNKRSLNKRKNNRKDLLAKLEDLKKWREMVKEEKQNTKNKEDLLDQLNEYIGDFELFSDSFEDGDYDDDFYKERVELYENVKNNVKRFLNIKLKESVSNNNLNHNYNRNFAMEENKNSKEKFLKNKAKLLKNFDELKRWRDMVKEKQNTNDFAKKELLKRLDFRINCSKDCLNSLGDEDYDDIYCGQENNIHKKFEKIVGEYLGINLKESVSNNNLNHNYNQNFAMEENKNSKKKFLDNKKRLFSKLKELKDWIDSEKEKMKRMNLSNEKNSAFKKIDDIIKKFETSFNSLKGEECDDIFYNKQIKLYNNFKMEVEEYLKNQYKKSEDEYKKRIKKYSSNKKDIRKKLEDVRKWRIKVFENQDTNKEKCTLLKKIDDQIESFDVCLSSIEDKEFDDGLYKQIVEAYEYVKKEVNGYLININKGKGPSRKIKPEKIDKKDINQSKKIDKKDINQDINFEKGNKEVPIQRVNINDKQDEYKKWFKIAEGDVKSLLYYLRGWRDFITNKKIVLKDGKEEEILEQIDKNIKYYETWSEYLYIYKQISAIKRFHYDALKDFNKFVNMIVPNIKSYSIEKKQTYEDVLN